MVRDSTQDRTTGLRVQRASPTPLQYVLLGLLRDRPAHGYDLMHAFAEGGELSVVVPTGQPALYAALKDLATRGLIEGRETRDGLRPPRTEYRVTPRGASELHAWLGAPVHRMRQVRLDFLLKVYVAQRNADQDIAALVDAQIEACQTYLETLEQQVEGLGEEDYAYLVIESRTSAAQSTLDWLHGYRRRLGRGRSKGRGTR
jgi:PadR family transcriptional regulator AphA